MPTAVRTDDEILIDQQENPRDAATRAFGDLNNQTERARRLRFQMPGVCQPGGAPTKSKPFSNLLPLFLLLAISSLKCLNGDDGLLKLGDHCKGSSSCENELKCSGGGSYHKGKKYCYDHFPRKRGEICRSYLWDCERWEGFLCDEQTQTCRQKQQKERCGPNRNRDYTGPKDYGSCGEGMSCYAGLCYHDPRHGGEPCDGDAYLCAGGMTCRNGTCSSFWETFAVVMAVMLVVLALLAAGMGLFCFGCKECIVFRHRVKDGKPYQTILEMTDLNDEPNAGNILTDLSRRARHPPPQDSFPGVYEQWKELLAGYGHVHPPSTLLNDSERRYMPRPCPYDVFLICTKDDKKFYVDTMKEIFEPRGFRCFLDFRSIAPTYGSPSVQMRNALESCRYAVALISRSFLTKEDPCAELEYSFKRMTWIRENKRWESLRVILIDVTVEDYERYKGEWRSSLPDLSTDIPMFSYTSGEFRRWPDLCHAVKADLFDHDVNGDATNGRSIEKWRSLLSEWGTEDIMSGFPRAHELYPRDPSLSGDNVV